MTLPTESLHEPVAPRGRAYFACAFSILLLGVTLRWLNFGGPSVWFDEAYSAWAAGLPVRKLIDVVRVDNSPPLYYLILHAWTSVFGESEQALRAPSAIAGTLALVGVWPLARRLFDDPAAELLALLLSAVSFLQIRYAQEARTYEMLALLALVTQFGLTDFSRGRTLRAHVLVIGSLSAMTWMHNMAWLYVASVVVQECIGSKSDSLRSRSTRAVAHLVAILVLFLPWMSVLYSQATKLGAGGFWIARPDSTALYYMTVLVTGAKLASVASVWKYWTGAVEPALSVGQLVVVFTFVISVIGTIMQTDAVRRRRLAALCAAGLGPLVMAYLVSRIGTSVFTPKALIASSVVCPLLLAGATTCSMRPIRRLAIVSIVLFSVVALLSVVGQFTTERREDWRSAHAYLASMPPGKRLLVFVGNDGQLGLDFYDTRAGRINADRTGVPHEFFDDPVPRAMQRVSSADDVSRLLERIKTGGYDSVVYIGSHQSWSDPRDTVRTGLRQSLRSTDHKLFDGVNIEVFETIEK